MTSQIYDGFSDLTTTESELTSTTSQTLEIDQSVTYTESQDTTVQVLCCEFATTTATSTSTHDINSHTDGPNNIDKTIASDIVSTTNITQHEIPTKYFSIKSTTREFFSDLTTTDANIIKTTQNIHGEMSPDSTSDFIASSTTESFSSDLTIELDTLSSTDISSRDSYANDTFLSPTTHGIFIDSSSTDITSYKHISGIHSTTTNAGIISTTLDSLNDTAQYNFTTTDLFSLPDTTSEELDVIYTTLSYIDKTTHQISTSTGPVPDNVRASTGTEIISTTHVSFNDTAEIKPYEISTVSTALITTTESNMPTSITSDSNTVIDIVKKSTTEGIMQDSFTGRSKTTTTEEIVTSSKHLGSTTFSPTTLSAGENN